VWIRRYPEVVHARLASDPDLRFATTPSKKGTEQTAETLGGLVRQRKRSEGREAAHLETAEQLSQRFSDRKFYDQNLREALESVHPGAILFALYFPPSSIVRDDAGSAQGEAQASAVIFATGEALISIPAKTRRGAPTVADLSVPVRVRGHIQDGRFVFDGADLAPTSAYFPPLIPDRVTRSRRAAQ
jgi:hypothetical protein